MAMNWTKWLLRFSQILQNHKAKPAHLSSMPENVFLIWHQNRIEFFVGHTRKVMKYLVLMRREHSEAGVLQSKMSFPGKRGTPENCKQCKRTFKVLITPPVTSPLFYASNETTVPQSAVTSEKGALRVQPTAIDLTHWQR